MKKAQKIDTPFLDVGGAAGFLGVEVSTIYSWSHQKRRLKFPVRKHGSKLAFLADELKQWSDFQNGLGPAPEVQTSA